MWGTIARMRVTPGAERYLAAQLHSWSTERLHGWVSTRLFRSAADPQEFWMVVEFEDEATYRRNEESAAQQQIYRLVRSQLEADIEWHDVQELELLEP